MSTPTESLSSLKIAEQDVKLERNLLKDLAADALRDYISTGQIPEGTKLTERELSQMLGISRMPVHDALLILETEGLIERRQGARYVITLSEDDVRDLHIARKALEKEAVILAANNINPENRSQLLARLDDFEKAMAAGERHLTAKYDMALHHVVWQQANNKYILELLQSLMGVIFIINDRLKVRNIKFALDPDNEHRKIVESVIRGDAVGAGALMQVHLESSLIASLDTFRTINKT